jgi:hypothetical protein
MSKLRYHAAWFTRMAVSAWRYVSIFENIYADYISFFQKNMGCTNRWCAPLIQTQEHCPCMCFFWGSAPTVLQHHACFFILISPSIGCCYCPFFVTLFCQYSPLPVIHLFHLGHWLRMMVIIYIFFLASKLLAYVWSYLLLIMAKMVVLLALLWLLGY